MDKADSNKLCETSLVTSLTTTTLAERAWKEDMAKIDVGTRLLFMNDPRGADCVFRGGMVYTRSFHNDVDPSELDGLRDLRSIFATLHAMVSVVAGVTSLAKDQLDGCLQRLWYAEGVAANEKDWIGKSVARGIVTLMGGLIQCLKHSFVKGVFNVIKSWMWIKNVQKSALDVNEKEREVVRSGALLTLGIFHLSLNLLPPNMLKAASFFSGLRGDREAGLKMLRTCWKEGGIFSTWGALAWVSFNVDTKTFLDERITSADMEDCAAIFKWANKKYPNSVLFSGAEAEFEACRHNVTLSIRIIERAMPFAKYLQTLEWSLNYKRGIYELVSLDFEKAAFYFSRSLDTSVRAGRRSMVPFMAIYIFLCYHVVADHLYKLELTMDEALRDNPEMAFESEGNDNGIDFDLPASNLIENFTNDYMDSATAAAHADEMLALIAKCKRIKKVKWGRQDRYAFAVVSEYDAWLGIDDEATGDIPNEAYHPELCNEFVAARKPWPLLDLVDCMIFRMRCNKWMNNMQVARLLELLKQSSAGRYPYPEDDVRLLTCFSQLLVERGQLDKALYWCECGLALESEVKNTDRIVVLLYLKAFIMFQRGQLLSANHFLSQLDSTTQPGDSMPWITFKVSILRKQLEDMSADEASDYTTTEIAAGSSYQHVVAIETDNVVSWDWIVHAHDIQFTILFRPQDDSNQREMITSIERHSADEKPCVGYFESPIEGDLVFEWDNRYSFLRSKCIVFRISKEAKVKLEYDLEK